MIRAGVDPGKNGWIVAGFPDGLRVWKTPTRSVARNKKLRIEYDLPAFADMLREVRDAGVEHVTIEAQQAARNRAGQASSGNFAVRASYSMGYGMALWELGLSMVGIPYDTVSPSVWKRAMGVTVPKGTPPDDRYKVAKELSVRAATSLWPDHNFVPSSRHREPSHDMCDAALLMRYGEMKALGSA